jgi:hypothetical protein
MACPEYEKESKNSDSSFISNQTIKILIKKIILSFVKNIIFSYKTDKSNGSLISLPLR